MLRNSSPNVEGMIKAKKQESETKKALVLSVLNELITLDDPIYHPVTKAEICRKAGVSKTFLYKYKEDILKPINDAVKNQNAKLRFVVTQPKSFSDSSKDKLIESLKRRVKKLEEENKELRNRSALLLGKLAAKQ